MNPCPCACRRSKKPCCRNEEAVVRFNNKSCLPVSPEWVSLPSEILFLILGKLLEPIDRVRFCAVCKEWRSLAKQYYNRIANQKQQQQQQQVRHVLPMLLIRKPGDGTLGTLYSVSQGKVYSETRLRMPYKMRCFGSCYGWLSIVYFDWNRCVSITLQNPFRSESCPIFLPPLNPEVIPCAMFLYKSNMPKVILSADPISNPGNYVVVACYSPHWLAFIKRGKKDWTYIKVEESAYSFIDVIFYKSQVYSVGYSGEIVSLDVNKRHCRWDPPEPKLLTLPRPFKHPTLKAYLVESTKGDLFHVRRFYKCLDNSKFLTDNFMVYKLVFNDKGDSIAQQVPVKNIGDEALFVGDNHSISVLASKFPGCKPNSIYYTNDFKSFKPEVHYAYDVPSDDMGIFNLEDGTFTQHYSQDPNLKGCIPPALWVVPPFDGLS